jgi:hypothetical protein
MKLCCGKALTAKVHVLAGILALGTVAQAQAQQCDPDKPGLQITSAVAEGELLDAQGNTVQSPTVSRLCFPNLAVADVLSRLDIDRDDVPDGARDTDGDGLPDNWELGGVERLDLDGDGRLDDRVVFFPAPSAIVPGTPPTPIFTRRAIATSALSADTDHDGLTDYTEVFGLMFIDENHDGVLDGNEWADLSGDGLPSPGEYPRDNTGTADFGGVVLLADFDGFVFTDPTNPDTDGDGILDGDDRDPLINPRSFGLAQEFIIRFDADDDDIDNDGLGNGMDMGNDLSPQQVPGRSQTIDNPANVRDLLDLFREDLLGEGVVPESTIEDLIGADWDGNGLWRTTDVREWSLVIADPQNDATIPPPEFFRLDPEDPNTNLYHARTFDELDALFNEPSFDRYGGRGIGLGWQEVAKPTSADAFMPDARIWAILYAWRMPGFDIDGDGFVGVPNLSSTVDINGYRTVALVRSSTAASFRLSDEVSISVREDENHKAFDDRIPIGEPESSDPELDGVIQIPGLGDALRSIGCGGVSVGMLMVIALGLAWPRFRSGGRGGLDGR